MTDAEIRAFIEFARRRPEGAPDLVYLYDEEDDFMEVRTTYDYPSDNHLSAVITEFLSSREGVPS